MSEMPLRRGAHAPLEEAADRLIKESLRNVTRHADKSDILTPWKEYDRRSHEVMVPSGTPDAAVRSGIFTRVLNPQSSHLNSRMGQVRGKRISGAHLRHSGAMSESTFGADSDPSWDGE